MKRRILALIALFSLAGGARAEDAMVPGAIVQTEQMRVALSADRTAASPGERIWVALSFDLKPGWHTYWRTPGDAGEAITIGWTLPKGVTAGPIQWPTPERFDYSGIAGFGYTGHATLLTQVTIDPSVTPPGDIVLKADATWLSCADVCIPEEGALSLPIRIVAADAGPNVRANPAFAAARAALPRPAPWRVKATRRGDTLTLTAGPGVSERALKSALYFPFDGALIDNGAKQDFRLKDGALEMTVALTGGANKHGDAAGVLRLERSDGATVGYAFAAPIIAAGD
jgi:thiol:disulfide interchange protein DsbD